MGRTRRRGPRPRLACRDIQYDTLERFHNLKKHKDEALYSVYDRACTSLEEYTDSGGKTRTEILVENMGKIQKIVTAKGTDLSLLIEFLEPQALQSFLNKHRNELSDETVTDIRKSLEKISV